MSFGAKSDYVNQLQEETNLKRSNISKMKQNMDNIDNVLGVSRLVSQSKAMDSASPPKSEAVSQNRGKPFLYNPPGFYDHFDHPDKTKQTLALDQT